MNTSVNIKCVGFSGFYGSIFDEGEQLYNAIYEDERYTFGIPKDSLVEDEDYTFDSKGYRRDIAETWVSAYLEKIRTNLGIDCELELSEIYSPKYYNYETDCLYADFKCRHFKQMMRKTFLPLMRKHKEKLTKVIYDNHTSYDGFISFMSNKYDEWYSYLANSKNYNDTDFCLYFGYMLFYLTEVENGHQSCITYEMECEVWEDTCIYSYINYLISEDEIIEKYGEAE